MSVDNESGELDIKLASASPTMQSDTSTDGDANTTQITSNSNDKAPPVSQEAPTSCEPKAKKRRKQSNPLKIQNPSSPKFDLSAYDAVDQTETVDNQNAAYDFEEGILNLNQESLNDKSKGVEHLSQKGALSRVTNALLNNKVKEAAKVSSKSKESSLQSLTDISSPESGEDVLSNEYKNSLQSVYSNMPSILPINPVDVANDVSKLANIYDYISPVQQANVNLSVSQRSFVTSSGVRVFNPEAYCELCEKEFCNKYFLKTHKANKHGICSAENSPGGGYGGYRVSYKNMHLNPQATQQMISQMCETGATFGSADSYCNICQKYFCNKYFLKKHRQNIHGIYDEGSSNIPSSIHVPVISSPLPLIRQVSHETKSAENSSGIIAKDEDSLNVSIENIKNSMNINLPLLNGSSPTLIQNKNTNSINQKEKKPEKFLCELCNIEFCEKCYLDAHMLNKHGSMKIYGNEFPEFSEVGKVETNDKGILSEDIEESKEFKGQMCTPCMKNFTSAESFQNHMLEVHGASLKEGEDVSKESGQKNNHHFENGILASMEKSSTQEMDSSNSNDSVTYNCNMCFQKYKDKKSFLTHAESEHGIVGSAALEASNLLCDACSEQFPDRTALTSHKFKVHGIIPPGLETHVENGEYIYYQGLRQKSSGSSFCEICNKELCNKYFMKTHMLKMHGIDVDKAQIERYPTPSSGGGVYCDICQKFLCSKYFLKVHKQNVHGIADDSIKVSLTGETLSYNSLLNDKKAEKFSPTSSFNNKMNSNKESLSVNDDPVKRSNGNVFSCEICGQMFHDKLTLQIHLVNKHVKCNDSKFFPNPYALSDDSKDALNAGILPCPCCSFVNLDDNSKITQMNGIDNKIISCILCNVTYHQSDYHTHHLSHGTSLPAGKNNYENGTLNELDNGFNDSGNVHDDPNKNMRPKLKRFRCSKCDKTFRTKMKCLHHIQVMHKIKKGLSNSCDSQNPSKKISLNHNFKKSDHKTSGSENGTSSICTKESDDRAALLSSCLPDGAPLPVPYILPKNSDVIMQPFHLTEPKSDEATKQNIFVPSVVYLPVSQKVSEKLTVAFTLTPA